MQQYVGIYILQNHSTCFGCHSTHHQEYIKTVTAASGTGHNIGTATSLQRGPIGTRWREVAVPVLWPVPEAAVTVFMYSWWWVLWHPKHVEWFCRYKYLHNVPSIRIFINIDKLNVRKFHPHTNPEEPWGPPRFLYNKKWSEVTWSKVKCREGGKNETLWDKFIWVVKWWEVKGWGESVSEICVGKNTGNCIQYFLTLVLFTFRTCCILRCLVCILVSCLVCIVLILCIFAVLCVYCCFYFRCRTTG